MSDEISQTITNPTYFIDFYYITSRTDLYFCLLQFSHKCVVPFILQNTLKDNLYSVKKLLEC